MMPDLASEPEPDLLKRSRQGDTSAFGELVRRHQETIYMHAYQIIRNEDDAMDLAQDTFVRAWRSITTFDGRHSLASWLRRITTNAAIDLCRFRQRRPQSEVDDTVLRPEAGSRTTPSGGESPEQALERTETRHRIEEAFAQLSPEHRAVISLKEIDGLSYEEIAQSTGASLGTVMSRLFYARRKLQSLLKDLHEQI